MRTNGLTAATYTPVADLQPQVAEILLADLATQGVAAYTKPVEATSTSGFDRPEFTNGVKDRLYVDTGAADRVRDLINERDPGLLDANEDLTWAQLVAGFDQPVQDVVARWPVVEDLQPTDARVVDERDLPVADEEPRRQLRRWGSRNDADGDGTGFDDDFLDATRPSRHDDDDDDVEHFVPEPPPPLPKLPPFKQIAWACLIGGPLLLIVRAMFGMVLPSYVVGLAVVGFIGGFVTLVATMGDDNDDDWDPNGGAVV